MENSAQNGSEEQQECLMIYWEVGVFSIYLYNTLMVITKH